MDSELHGFAAVQVSHKREQGTKGDEGLHIVYSLVNLILSVLDLADRFVLVMSF